MYSVLLLATKDCSAHRDMCLQTSEQLLLLLLLLLREDTIHTRSDLKT